MSDDYISRQAVLDMLEDINNHIIDGYGYRHDWCVEWVKGLPSAQPEQKKGKWIKATGMMPPEFHGHHCCSECGNFANMEPPFGSREDLSKFCPNCGADMRERKEE